MCVPNVTTGMPTDDQRREQGVEFGSLADDLESEEYPKSKEALLEEYGPAEVELEDGAQTLQEILGPMGETTYESAEDVMQDIIGNVSEEAVGRQNYTDRGGTTKEGERNEESM